ncbi:hypothetical protein, partial [Microvirga lupini]|uniref:hypothetical protein n=1 Tax=Microvirga lupini TaxID=420324 RepID=UPI001AEE857D
REEASRLFLPTIHHRAGLPYAPPSISPTGSQHPLRAPERWLFDAAGSAGGTASFTLPALGRWA